MDVSGESNGVALKEVTYQDGSVVFRIPADWVQEREGDGTDVFYGKGSDATLRLSVMHAKASQPADAAGLLHGMLGAMASAEGTVREFDNNTAVATSIDRRNENGLEIMVQEWTVISPIPPQHLRVAVFSYAFRAAEAESAQIKQEIALLDREIVQARISRELPPARKPWWKIWR